MLRSAGRKIKRGKGLTFDGVSDRLVSLSQIVQRLLKVMPHLQENHWAYQDLYLQIILARSWKPQAFLVPANNTEQEVPHSSQFPIVKLREGIILTKLEAYAKDRLSPNIDIDECQIDVFSEIFRRKICGKRKETFRNLHRFQLDLRSSESSHPLQDPLEEKKILTKN